MRLVTLAAALALLVNPAAAAEAVPFAAPAPMLIAQAPIPAPANLVPYRGQTGLVLHLVVVGSPTGSVWGDGVYTDDSSLAAAAVHYGLVQPGQQAVVAVEILGPQQSFSSAARNGITSSTYGPWTGSFRFVGIDTASVTTVATPDPGNLTGYAKLVGTQLTFDIVGAESGSVWGDGIYTVDSRLARAAVHAGLVKIGQSGTVTIEIVGPQQVYSGSERNGVVTSNWGPYEGFRFVMEDHTDRPTQADPTKMRRAPPQSVGG